MRFEISNLKLPAVIMAKDTPNVFYNCREPSTNRPTFMQNEPNFGKVQMNVNKVLTKDYENKPNWTLGENEPKTNPIKPNRRPLAGNPKLEILNPKQIRMNEIQRYKTRFFAEFILEQSEGLEMTTKWISAHRETILCKTKPIQTQLVAA